MTNKLQKSLVTQPVQSSTFIPGSPAVPARPKRTLKQTREVCAVRYPNVPGITYKHELDPKTGRLVTLPIFPEGTTIVSSRGVYSCREEKIDVVVPATPAQPATPGRYENNTEVRPTPNLGWNAGARSVARLRGDGLVGFKAPIIQGAIAGLNINNTPGEPGYTGGTIDYGFRIQGNLYWLVHNGGVVPGTGVETFTAGTVFQIRREGSNVYWDVAGTPMWSIVDAPLGGEAWLEAVLYAADDYLYDPYLTPTGVEPDLGVTGTLNITLPSLAMLMADAPYSELRMYLPKPEPTGEGGAITITSNYLALTLPPLSLDARGGLRARGTLNLTLPAPGMFISDVERAELRMVLPGLNVDAEQEQPGAQAFDAFQMRDFASATVTGAAGQVGDGRDKFEFDIDMSAGAKPQADGRDRYMVDVAMSVRASHCADGTDFYQVDVRMVGIRSAVGTTPLPTPGGALPDNSMEVHAVNMDGFGSTSYSNFSFNSFARIGDHYFGARAAGIFRLEGANDAGAPVRAIVSPGRLDFGSPQNKTIVEAWMGVRCAKPMSIKLMAEGRQFLYEADTFNAAYLEQHRAKFGKGLQANYIAPVLFNQDGEPFELDALEFAFTPLSRKY